MYTDIVLLMIYEFRTLQCIEIRHWNLVWLKLYQDNTYNGLVLSFVVGVGQNSLLVERSWFFVLLQVN